MLRFALRLLSLMTVLGCLGQTAAQSLTLAVSSGSVAEQYLLAAANAERALLHLAPLRRDPTLVHAATLHARLMAAHESISHQYASEPELSARGAAAHARFSRITENVAEAPSPIALHDAWMRSAGHRANLLDETVDSVGIAVVRRGQQLYAVEDFSRFVVQLSLAEQESAVASLLAPSGLAIETAGQQADHAARETCALPNGFAGRRRPSFIMRYSTASLSQLPEQLRRRLRSGRVREAAVGACIAKDDSSFTRYSIAVLLYP